jgi:SAM-dependent methyltransferase
VQKYDRIGAGYAARRRPDQRLAARIRAALGDAATILNVGAGAGSYEPLDRFVVAVEPALTMLRQRSASSAPAIRGAAEALPFGRGAFDAAMALLTIHHWSDWRVGLREMARVARGRVVVFTWDPRAAAWWLNDYFPRIVDDDRHKAPLLDEMTDVLGGSDIVTVPIPHDCSDGFMGAYWRRPESYLDANVRQAISSLAKGEGDDGLARLAGDLSSGEWRRKNARILELDELDVGYRLVIA